ncbi:MAG: Unknown protein [uncultured Sulfurovum sp.]|uniref:Uncharacterized protein n=1 Tax=uncultured Sulfurovum sp. TaxID=269237 RepID=A0A6S6THR2_9BACT|nr:MAG: Unknown protein [uncultured Sulfurovum sp.]
MMKKTLFLSLFLFGIAYADSSTINTATTNDTPKSGWNLSEIKTESGESCEDGNCLHELNCFQKDGPMYSFFSIFTDAIKDTFSVK